MAKIVYTALAFVVGSEIIIALGLIAYTYGAS